MLQFFFYIYSVISNLQIDIHGNLRYITWQTCLYREMNHQERDAGNRKKNR